MLKAFFCNDSELYAAACAEQAEQLYFDDVGERCNEGYPRELTDAELDAEQPEFDENEKRTNGVTSVRKMLAEHGDVPGYFAGTP